MLSDDVDVDPIDEGGWGEINIKENTYYFRAFFELKKPDGSMVRSPFSNVVEIGTSAFYSNASNWAKPELQKAYDLGLIPAILDGADMTKPITREEFAELAVMLYEKVSNKKSEPFSPNPFTDTINPQILKAYKIGITAGTSPTTFSPKVLIDREQCAAMLFRTIKAIYPNGDYSITGVKDFLDQKDISHGLSKQQNTCLKWALLPVMGKAILYLRQPLQRSSLSVTAWQRGTGHSYIG